MRRSPAVWRVDTRLIKKPIKATNLSVGDAVQAHTLAGSSYSEKKQHTKACARQRSKKKIKKTLAIKKAMLR